VDAILGIQVDGIDTLSLLADLFIGIFIHESKFIIRGRHNCYYKKTNSCWVFKLNGATHLTYATEAAKERDLLTGNDPDSDEIFNTSIRIEKKIRTSIFGSLEFAGQGQSDRRTGTLPAYPRLERQAIDCISANDYILATLGEYEICFPKPYNGYGYENLGLACSHCRKEFFFKTQIIFNGKVKNMSDHIITDCSKAPDLIKCKIKNLFLIYGHGRGNVDKERKMILNYYCNSTCSQASA